MCLCLCPNSFFLKSTVCICRETNCVGAAFKNYVKWGEMVPSSDREFHEKLKREKKERLYEYRHSSGSQSITDEESLAASICSTFDNLPSLVKLEMPADVAAMKTNLREPWDVFIEVMSLQVPDPLPHLSTAPKKAAKPGEKKKIFSIANAGHSIEIEESCNDL